MENNSELWIKRYLNRFKYFFWVWDIFQLFIFPSKNLYNACSLNWWLLMSNCFYLHLLQPYCYILQPARISVCLEVSRFVSYHQHVLRKPKWTIFSTFSCVCYYWWYHTWPEVFIAMEDFLYYHSIPAMGFWPIMKDAKNSSDLGHR